MRHVNHTLERHGTLLGLTLLLLAVWSSSYEGRVNIIDAQRRGCQSVVLDRVDRRDDARTSYTANYLVATDPRQPARTRRARLAQAAQNLRSARNAEARIPSRFHVPMPARVGGPPVPVVGSLDCNEVYPRAHVVEVHLPFGVR